MLQALAVAVTWATDCGSGSMTLPDRFIEQDKPERMLAEAGLDAAGIVAAVFATLDREGIEQIRRA